ncbi:MAG TPA: FtsQ-type POTRA domain-containing protein [Anaerolineae bacterium]|nr:FtsQ-type POTRA domain-containing protein [Anaerolineae bacterium]
MKRRTARNRKRKRFEAPSISALLPGTLQKEKAGRQRRRPALRKRKKPGVWEKVTARWGFSHYVAGLLAIVGLIGLFLLLTDPRFTIETPTVTGNQYLDAAEIIHRSEVDQTNIFLVQSDDIARRLSLIPQVKETQVHLGLPNRVVIAITERQPVLNYVRKGETLWVDDEGRLFPANEFRTDLPVLLDDDDFASPDGQHMDSALVQAILFLHASMPEITEFNYRSDYGLYFNSPEKWRVYLGDAQNMEAKLRKWQHIRPQLLQEGRPVKNVDLRFDNVYVTYAR